MRKLDPELLESLRQLDSPTLSNAVERFKVRSRVSGFAGYDQRCTFPELGTMVGHAVTCTADSTTEDRSDRRGLLDLWEAVERSPRPSVIVIKDIGHDPLHSCHMGEVMATTAKTLGAVGCITDGGLRDVAEVRRLGGFQYFCPGFVVSHGNPVICQVDVPVTLSGVHVNSGDLIHGDLNGWLIVPEEVLHGVVEAAARVRDEEAQLLELIRTPGFSVEKLRKFQEKYRH